MFSAKNKCQGVQRGERRRTTTEDQNLPPPTHYPPLALVRFEFLSHIFFQGFAGGCEWPKRLDSYSFHFRGNAFDPIGRRDEVGGVGWGRVGWGGAGRGVAERWPGLSRILDMRICCTVRHVLRRGTKTTSPGDGQGMSGEGKGNTNGNSSVVSICSLGYQQGELKFNHFFFGAGVLLSMRSHNNQYENTRSFRR